MSYGELTATPPPALPARQRGPPRALGSHNARAVPVRASSRSGAAYTPLTGVTPLSILKGFIKPKPQLIPRIRLSAKTRSGAPTGFNLSDRKPSPRGLNMLLKR